ncbi:hypothetical protein [Pelagibius marinus]|uniref:hypothetical protein n=1 Tax=Pelagibius marinus TaxID=2762760 RepID=UPI001872D4B6|nr:hypothetical protein [Pelagibius marinus]
MRVLSQTEANDLLRPLGLEIGSWNGLNELGSEKCPYRVYLAPPGALELYVLAGHLLDWLAPKDWVLFQVDNSTVPVGDDEHRVFERLVFNAEQRWDIGTQRSFLFGDVAVDDPKAVREQLILLIFFALMFQWHVYLTCENAVPGQRLGLQDGAIYFIGDDRLIDRAEALIEKLTENPLRLSQPG